MDGLRQKLENQGLKNVIYLVVNHQGAQSQRLHPMLEQRLSQNITLYKQDEQQSDVWQTLNGEKDDFFIYDRCGRLTHHISLPYTIIGQGYVEGAIKDSYCKRICGECGYESAELPEECRERADAQPDADRFPPAEEDTGHGHHHRHHHGHGHHGFDHGHDENHGHHRGHHHDHGQDHSHGHHVRHHHHHDHGQSQSHHGFQQQGVPQDRLDLGQMQQGVHMHQMPQDAHGAAVRP